MSVFLQWTEVTQRYLSEYTWWMWSLLKSSKQNQAQINLATSLVDFTFKNGKQTPCLLFSTASGKLGSSDLNLNED